MKDSIKYTKCIDLKDNKTGTINKITIRADSAPCSPDKVWKGEWTRCIEIRHQYIYIQKLIMCYSNMFFIKLLMLFSSSMSIAELKEILESSLPPAEKSEAYLVMLRSLSEEGVVLEDENNLLSNILVCMAWNLIPNSREITILVLTVFRDFDVSKNRSWSFFCVATHFREKAATVGEIIIAMLEMRPEFAKNIDYADFSILIRSHCSTEVIQAYQQAFICSDAGNFCITENPDRLTVITHCGLYLIIEYEGVYYLLVRHYSTTEEVLEEATGQLDRCYLFPSWSTQTENGMMVARIGASANERHPPISEELANRIVSAGLPSSQKSARSGN
jgi:hypothetical protein